MKNHFVLDTSVFLTYASYNKLYRIANAVKRHGLTINIDFNLLDELEKNLPKVIKVAELTPEMALTLIIELATIVKTVPFFTNSPDPKDNFLFDLALQTNSEVIVTKEIVLLNFTESPIPIHNIKWFKEKFPVGL